VALAHSSLPQRCATTSLMGRLSGFIQFLANQTWTRRSSKTEKEPTPLHRFRDSLVSGLFESIIPAPCSPLVV
jgi:hypothetical protein